MSLSAGSGDVRSNPQGCRLSSGPYSSVWLHFLCRRGDSHSTSTFSRKACNSLLFRQTSALSIAIWPRIKQKEDLEALASQCLLSLK
jgi:hypothetical protein